MHSSAKLKRWVPLLLSFAIVGVDQLTKALIVAKVPVNTIGWRGLSDFLWIVHARNTGIVFSIGAGLPELVRRVIFMVLPLVLMVGIGVYYLGGQRATRLQRWAIALIIGGGLGNLVDRVFRPDGVVDFISTRMYGLLGMERWPTWNVADSCIVVGACLVALSAFFEPAGATKRE
ncbi:MAG: signal peptidase II [Spirochaetales bacterium]|nr:signal peptidase II [Spirochaetales bacterium]